MSKEKAKKRKKRWKNYRKKRNILKNYLGHEINRRKSGEEEKGLPVQFPGGNEIDFRSKIKMDKHYCNECVHSKRNRKSQITSYYCDVYDKDNLDDLYFWGKFEGNKNGRCPEFKKSSWFKKLWKKKKNIRS